MIEDIDELKAEGIWNNDWDASLELLKRYSQKKHLSIHLPKRKDLIEIFSNYYFGGNPQGDNQEWSGFIKDEPLLVNKQFFDELSKEGICWGFVSGAESPSAKFVLQNRLHLTSPPLITMEDAPEKPNPIGFIKLASQLAKQPLGPELPPIGYLGDTVADVLTVKYAKQAIPNQKFISFGIAPPHLHEPSKAKSRLIYENKLLEAGADKILSSTYEAINQVLKW